MQAMSSRGTAAPSRGGWWDHSPWTPTPHLTSGSWRMGIFKVSVYACMN